MENAFPIVDAFIEHKKQNHFTQFQNTTSIVFEESEQGEQCPIIIKAQNPPLDENNEPRIKIEVQDEDPINSFSSEIIDEPNLDLVELKSELITYNSEMNPDDESNFLSSKQSQQNPYVLLKRLTWDEIQGACVPNPHFRHLAFEQIYFVNKLEAPDISADIEINNSDLIKVKKSKENPPSSTFVNISTKPGLQFECKLCSKILQSESQLKIHGGICGLYHKHRNRFCVSCNRKFCDTNKSKLHRRRFHGTEEEKLSLFRFKCHFCPKKYQNCVDFRFHLASHPENKDQVEASTSNLFKCSHPNCGKEFRDNYDLQRHSATHSQIKPFNCSFPNCNKGFTQRTHLNIHFLSHIGERPYKCTVDNCNKAYTTYSQRMIHYRNIHPILLNEIVNDKSV